jgi:hypothetical protein
VFFRGGEKIFAPLRNHAAEQRNIYSLMHNKCNKVQSTEISFVSFAPNPLKGAVNFHMEMIRVFSVFSVLKKSLLLCVYARTITTDSPFAFCLQPFRLFQLMIC